MNLLLVAPRSPEVSDDDVENATCKMQVWDISEMEIMDRAKTWGHDSYLYYRRNKIWNKIFLEEFT